MAFLSPLYDACDTQWHQLSIDCGFQILEKYILYWLRGYTVSYWIHTTWRAKRIRHIHPQTGHYPPYPHYILLRNCRTHLGSPLYASAPRISWVKDSSQGSLSIAVYRIHVGVTLKYTVSGKPSHFFASGCFSKNNALYCSRSSPATS